MAGALPCTINWKVAQQQQQQQFTNCASELQISFPLKMMTNRWGILQPNFVYYNLESVQSHFTFQTCCRWYCTTPGCSTDQSPPVSATLVVLERRKGETGLEPSLYPTSIPTPRQQECTLKPSPLPFASPTLFHNPALICWFNKALPCLRLLGREFLGNNVKEVKLGATVVQ